MGCPWSSSGKAGSGWGQPEVGHDPQLVGRVGHEVTEEPQHLAGLRHGPRQQAGQDGGAERVEPVLERGDHAEVAAAAPQAPEQVGVLLLAGDKKFPVGGDHVAGHEAVNGESEAAHEVADATPQGQPADAGVGDDAAGHGQPERLGLVVDVTPQTAALCPGVRASGSNRTPVMADRSITRPPSQRHAQRRRDHRLGPPPAAPAPGQTASRPDVGGSPYSGRCGGPPLDVPVPDLSGGLVTLVTRLEHLSEESFDLHHALLHRCVQVDVRVRCGEVQRLTCDAKAVPCTGP